jgi:hypothetical protein
MGRALLVDCDGGWRRAVPCVWYAGFNTPLDVCDIIIRGQSVCIRDHFSVVFFCCLFLFIWTDMVISDHVKMELRDLTCA